MWLVDPDGDVIVEDTDSGRDVRIEGQDTGLPLDRDPLPIAEVRDAIATRDDGGVVELSDGKVAAWSRLEELGWTFVVRGDAASLIAPEP